VRGVFIAGTDTNVGKTWVACQLLINARTVGINVAAMKPIASGSFGFKNDDAVALINAAESEEPYELINPYNFTLPISPHLAAQEAGQTIDLQVICSAATKLEKNGAWLVVEGAGGWLTPISLHHTMADVARILNLPVILVVGMRLGCLSHALLSAAAITTSGLRLAGWVANSLPRNQTNKMLKESENIATLSTLLAEPPLAYFAQDDSSATTQHQAATAIARLLGNNKNR